MTSFEESLEYKNLLRQNAKSLKRIAKALEKIAEKNDVVMTFNQTNLGDDGICGDDDPDIPEKAGPCIRDKGHSEGPIGGGHVDKAGGEW